MSWRPILVGGIFNTINPSVYASREHPVAAKLAYQKKDMADWARSAGLAIKMRPTVFPVNSVKAMRGCIWLGKDMVPFARAVFEAYWGGDKDISQDAVLAEICKGLAIDSTRFFAGIGEQSIKDQLKANTDEVMATRRVRFADNLHRQDRYVFRQRPDATDPRSASAAKSERGLMTKAVVCRELGPPRAVAA